MIHCHLSSFLLKKDEPGRAAHCANSLLLRGRTKYSKKDTHALFCADEASLKINLQALQLKEPLLWEKNKAMAPEAFNWFYIVRKSEVLVNILLDHGVPVNGTPKKGCKERELPLITFLLEENEKLVALIVKKGALIDVPGQDGCTPLQCALSLVRASHSSLPSSLWVSFLTIFLPPGCFFQLGNGRTPQDVASRLLRLVLNGATLARAIRHIICKQENIENAEKAIACKRSIVNEEQEHPGMREKEEDIRQELCGNVSWLDTDQEMKKDIEENIHGYVSSLLGVTEGLSNDAVAREAKLLLDSELGALLNTPESIVLPPLAANRSEAIIHLLGRPALLIQKDTFQPPTSGAWAALLGSKRGFINNAITAVGRIELKNHPTHDWVGTGWLIAPGIVVTNRHVAMEFAAKTQGGSSPYRFKSHGGKVITARIDFKEEHGQDEGAFECAIQEVLHIEEEPGPDLRS